MTESLPAAERVAILTRRLAALNKSIDLDFQERLDEIQRARIALFRAQRELANGN